MRTYAAKEAARAVSEGAVASTRFPCLEEQRQQRGQRVSDRAWANWIFLDLTQYQPQEQRGVHKINPQSLATCHHTHACHWWPKL